MKPQKRIVKPKPKIETRGGVREGAGRPASDTTAIQFKLGTDTVKELRARVPKFQRSAFADTAIRAALEHREAALSFRARS